VSDLTELEVGILKGVQSTTIEKIRKSGIHTVEDLATQTPPHLSERASIGKDTAENAIGRALDRVSRGYVTGKQLHDELMTRTRLTTGSSELDTLLGGGIESETTTEVIGEKGSGKTQICHTLAVLAQLPIAEGGLNGEVAWIDTEDTFRADRIMQIAGSLGLNPTETLAKIHTWKALTSHHQRLGVEALAGLCHIFDIKLVIVDSMMAHLRSEYLGRGTLAERQHILNDILHKLSNVSQTWELTAVYTNQVMDDPGKMYGNPTKAVGGHIMGHAATTRVFLRKTKRDGKPVHIAKLMKSPYLPDGEAPFVVDEYGVRDTEKVRKEREKNITEQQ
jgi:DNA repair protein RadA